MIGFPAFLLYYSYGIFTEIPHADKPVFSFSCIFFHLFPSVASIFLEAVIDWM